DFSVLDAAYSEELKQLVLLTPLDVVVVDPITLDATRIGFGSNSTARPYGSIALAPGGKSAAVSRDRAVLIIDLVAGALKTTIPSVVGAGDVVMGGNGYAYVLPYNDGTGSGNFSIHSFDVAHGTEHGDDNAGFIAGDTLIKLQPGGSSIYAIEHVTPGQLERFDISKGDAVGPFVNLEELQGPSHAQCGDLWFNGDGTRIFNSCGTVFKASPGAKDDMTYLSSLAPFPSSTPSGAPFQWLSVDDAHDRIYAIAGAQFLNDAQQAFRTARTLAWYGYDSKELIGSKEVPCMAIHGQKKVVAARFAFHTADGTKVMVLTDEYPIGQSGLAVFEAE
ncbi:MAG TPA: hypothetical protein VJV79_01220, partial [Polyangiaceae bacterium]|nr:hypothetical protein [Polyangiaceae bacterium]